MADPYVYPGTHVLINKEDLRDEVVLGAFERTQTLQRLSEGIPNVECTPEGYREIHRHIFQDVYAWAGEFRSVNLSKGGDSFCLAPLVHSQMEKCVARIQAQNNLKGLSRDEFADRAADVMSELNGIHPFREGNGRVQRSFMERLAKESGHHLDFAIISPERMIRASIEAHRGENGAMRRLFRDASDPTRIQALRQAISSFEREGFRWRDHYLATFEPGRPVEVTMAGIAGDHFMAHTRSEILIGNTMDLPKPHPARREVFVVEPTTWRQLERPSDQRYQSEPQNNNQEQGGLTTSTRGDLRDIAARAEGVASVASGRVARVAGSVARAALSVAEMVTDIFEGFFAPKPPLTPEQQKEVTKIRAEIREEQTVAHAEVKKDADMERFVREFESRLRVDGEERDRTATYNRQHRDRSL